MYRWTSTLLVPIFALLISACTLQPVAGGASSADADALQGELLVFAAASLTDAFGVLETDFEAQYPGANVVFNFAGSQQLAQQLGQGAPADLFASANARQMEDAVEAGRVVSGTQQTFVRNRLVVIYPSDNPAELATLQDLAKPGVKLVLAAPEVPVGTYSLDFLKRAAATVEYGGIYSESVLANVVSYEENVRSVLSKVILGEADAGIVYTSDLFGDSAAQVGQIDIPDALNTVATYPIATVADSATPALAQAFVDYVLSAEGQATMAEYGFVPAGTP